MGFSNSASFPVLEHDKDIFLSFEINIICFFFFLGGLLTCCNVVYYFFSSICCNSVSHLAGIY